MAKYDEDTRYSALSLLNSGDSIKEVAERLDVPLTTIIRWNKELKASIEDGGMNKLVNMDRVVLGKVLEEVVTTDVQLADKTAELTVGLNYAARLNGDLHLAALSLVAKAKQFAVSADTSTELVILAEVLCSMQTAFFNSNSTNVNVQNNFGGSEGYDEFLSDEPAA